LNKKIGDEVVVPDDICLSNCVGAGVLDSPFPICLYELALSAQSSAQQFTTLSASFHSWKFQA